MQCGEKALLFYLVLLSVLCLIVTSKKGVGRKRKTKPQNPLQGSCIDHIKCDEWLDFQDLFTSCKIDRNRKLCKKTCTLCSASPQSTTTTEPPTTVDEPLTTSADHVTTATPSVHIGGHCVDRNQLHCPAWVRNGYCFSNPSSMRYHCSLSCGFCQIKTAEAPGCVDKRPLACPTWLDLCSSNPGVQKYCRKSCQLCTSLSTTTARTYTTPYAKTYTTTPVTYTTTSATTDTTTTIPYTTKSPSTKKATFDFVSTEISKTTPTNIQQSTRPKSRATTSKKVTKIPVRPLTGRTSGMAPLATKATVIPTAEPHHSTSRVNTTVVIAICVTGILLLACVVIALFYRRWKNKQSEDGGPASSTPGNRIIMQPFNYSDPKSLDTKRDSGIVDCDEDPYTNPTNQQPVYHVVEGPSNQLHIHHVLEDNITNHSIEPVYACASTTGRQNEAYESEYDYTVPEGIVTSLVSSTLRPQADVRNISMETPYYHTLESPNVSPGRYQELIRPMKHSGYQPIIRRGK